LKAQTRLLKYCSQTKDKDIRTALPHSNRKTTDRSADTFVWRAARAPRVFEHLRSAVSMRSPTGGFWRRMQTHETGHTGARRKHTNPSHYL